MNPTPSSALKQYILQVAELYHRYRVDSEQLRRVRYRIHSTLADYEKTHTLRLAITDKPGDVLPPLSIDEIKKSPDIISGLHPMDVNSINDLFYLSRDKVAHMHIQDEKIEVLMRDGRVIHYHLDEPLDEEHLASKRVAFMLGSMQAEKRMREVYTAAEQYKVLQDNITTLQVLDSQTNDRILMTPLDILFSEDYKRFAKEDVMRIGYICGQMSRLP